MTPSWDGPFERFARRWVNQNHWRVSYVYPTSEDALQQCACLFVTCCNLYGDKVDNEAWFMALYKQSLLHHWNTMSRRNAKQQSLWSDVEAPEAAYSMDLETMDMWLRASPDLRAVLRTVSDASPELLAMMFKGINDPRQRERVSRRWLRICGIKSRRDVVGELRSLLGVPA